MKLSKILFGAMAMVASLSFFGCAEEDDPNNMIDGARSNYSINYTNESTTNVSRGYHSTNFKHCGAIVKITIENPAATPNGVMGVIFDYEEANGKRSFDVVGLRTKGATDGKLGCYVSRYENVTDIQADNFGAVTGGTATETEYVALDAKTATGTYNATAKTVTIYALPILVEKTTGVFVYRVYLLTGDVAKITDDGKVHDSTGAEYTLDSNYVAEIPTSYKSLEQKRLAVYANVYKSSTLKGTWEYLGDYHEVVVEE